MPGGPNEFKETEDRKGVEGRLQAGVEGVLATAPLGQQSGDTDARRLHLRRLPGPFRGRTKHDSQVKEE